MDYSRVVLGIGNPGAEYEGTRHNAGFLALDLVASREGCRFHRLERRAPDGTRLYSGRVKAHVAGLSVAESAVLLVNPLTYVNLSGDVAGPLLRAARLSPDALFVVVDDLNLPLGRLRIRPAGSSGGHGGLKSIEQALGTDEYPRLRLGIGQALGSAATTPDVSGSPGRPSDVVDFVLARFLPGEREVLASVLERAADVIQEWMRGDPVETLMGRHNGYSVGGGEHEP